MKVPNSGQIGTHRREKGAVWEVIIRGVGGPGEGGIKGRRGQRQKGASSSLGRGQGKVWEGKVGRQPWPPFLRVYLLGKKATMSIILDST